MKRLRNVGETIPKRPMTLNPPANQDWWHSSSRRMVKRNTFNTNSYVDLGTGGLIVHCTVDFYKSVRAQICEMFLVKNECKIISLNSKDFRLILLAARWTV